MRPGKRKTGNARSGSPRRKALVSGTGARAVFLVGFMGAGKSSVGRALGQRLGWTFEDLDDRIQRREKRTVAEIFRTAGEAEFRRAERAALAEVLKELRGEARIVALGGGAFVQRGNAAKLKAAGAPTVFLDAPVEELWQRCQKQALESGTARPLLRNLKVFCDLYETRRRGYSKASLRVETGSRSVDEIAGEIAAVLGIESLMVKREA